MNIQSAANRYPAAVAIALFLNFVILVGMASYVLIDNFKKIEKSQAYKILHGIGKLKVGQIQAYFHGRKGDARVAAKFLSNSPARHWLANPSGNIPATAQQPLETVLSAYQYAGGVAAGQQGEHPLWQRAIYSAV